MTVVFTVGTSQSMQQQLHRTPEIVAWSLHLALRHLSEKVF